MSSLFVYKRRHAVRLVEEASPPGVLPLHPVWSFAPHWLSAASGDHAAVHLCCDHGQNDQLCLRYCHTARGTHCQNVAPHPRRDVFGEVCCHLFSAEARWHCHHQEDGHGHRCYVDSGLFRVVHPAFPVCQSREHELHSAKVLHQKHRLPTTNLFDFKQGLHHHVFCISERNYHLYIHCYHDYCEVGHF